MTYDIILRSPLREHIKFPTSQGAKAEQKQERCPRVRKRRGSGATFNREGLF